MSAEQAHSKVLNAAAKLELGALGLRRKGRSRTWLDDRGWWLGVVEFQPSSYSRGTYLNVGVHWLWDGGSHLSFSVGGRVHLDGGEHHGQWFEFESEQQFGPVAQRLAAEASARIARYRTDFASPAAVAQLLARGEPTLLEALDAGVAYGLAGEPAAARPLFHRYLEWSASQEHSSRRDDDAQTRFDALGDPAVFSALIKRDIEHARAALKLDPVFDW